MPAAEVDIDVAMVAELVAEQFPSWRGQTIAPLASGWDNAVFRLGHELLVRLPRRAAGADLVEGEQRWLPLLAPSLPLPIPATVARGRPGCGYPWRWSVCPWFAGDIAARTLPADLGVAADALGAFLVALHQPAHPDAPRNSVRGGPLVTRDERTRAMVDQLGETIDRRVVLDAWDRALATPSADGEDLWLHGDLHPANLIVDDGRLAAVIDFGDLTGGDPATDLSVAWMLFDEPERARFRRSAGPAAADDATWARAKGWATTLAVAHLANSADNQAIAAIGWRTLHAVLADPSPDAAGGHSGSTGG